MPTVSPVYCVQADMERLFSVYGLTAFSDHEETGVIDEDVIDDCINHATEEINRFAMVRYSAAGLATSSLINGWCTMLAVVFLCHHRGNPVPESLQREFERIMEALVAVATGGVGGYLPGVALRADMRPSMSNLQIDRRYRHSTARVVKVNSTDQTTVLGQNEVNEIPIVYD